MIASDKELDLDLTEIIKQSNSAQKISDYTAKEISDKFFNEDPILLSKPLSIISDGFAKSIKEAINSRLYSGYPIEAKHIIYNICINDKQPSLYKDFFIRVALDIASKKVLRQHQKNILPKKMEVFCL